MALKSGVFACLMLASSLSCTDSVTTTSEPDQNMLNVQIEKLQAWNFSKYAKCAVRQRPAVMEGLPLSEEEYVVLAERALKIWYAAILAQPMKNYTPTAELDLVWHCHILDMHNYAGFLQQLGIKIGHVPFSDEETNDLAQYQPESILNAVSNFSDTKLLNTFFSTSETERGHKCGPAGD